MKYLFFLIILGSLFSCGGKTREDYKNERMQLEERIKEELKRKLELDEENIRKAKDQELLLQKWDYDTRTDEMTDKKIHWASCKSKNTEYLEFPYEGGTKLTLTIRNMKGKNEIYVTVNKGQLQTYDKYVSIRLDNGKAKNYSLIGSGDGDSKFAFIYAGNSLISQIKKASVIKIQLPFYGNGRRTFTFEPGILEWNH
jgi:hypothetical protein|nr:MAG TPA_asm: hypothetical protein [Caudoviricetes sp.]